MRNLCFLSTDNLEDFFVWDSLCEEPFAEQGFTIDTVSWHNFTHDYSQYEAVIVRTTWDYQNSVTEFSQSLARIEQSGTKLINPLPLMLWNINKRYLRTLSKQGVPIIPSIFLDNLKGIELHEFFEDFACDEVIFKPLVSANSDNTFRVSTKTLPTQEAELKSVFANTECMVQPFLSAIVDDGEYSLFFFNGQYSHTIKKVPKTGDFRVQEEHGGQLYSVQPTPAQLDVAQKVLTALPSECLYARVDLVDNKGQWQLMEVELIEPSLYFNMDPDSPSRFVTATIDYLAK